jgi:hypothetical protein
MAELTRHYLEAGRVVEKIEGYGVSCQSCGHWYAFDEHGIIKRDPRAFPLIGLLQPTPASGEKPPPDLPERPPAPAWREAPRV